MTLRLEGGVKGWSEAGRAEFLAWADVFNNALLNSDRSVRFLRVFQRERNASCSDLQRGAVYEIIGCSR